LSPLAFNIRLSRRCHHLANLKNTPRRLTYRRDGSSPRHLWSAISLCAARPRQPKRAEPQPRRPRTVVIRRPDLRWPARVPTLEITVPNLEELATVTITRASAPFPGNPSPLPAAIRGVSEPQPPLDVLQDLVENRQNERQHDEDNPEVFDDVVGIC